MKIRIKGNTLRLRLSQGEIRALKARASVSDQINFGPDLALQYSLQISNTDTLPSASFTDHHIRVFLPTAMANKWMDTEQVSIRSKQENGLEEALELLIEKDFRCLTERPGEDEEDLFPHPKENQANC